jgi:serine protease Do
MYKKLFLAALALVSISAVACGQVQEPAPSETPSASATLLPTASGQSTEAGGTAQPAAATQAPTAPPQAGPSTSTATAPQAPVAVQPSPSTQQGLTTVDVVKILRPSIVQIVTETLTTNFFNQPIPNQGVGTGIVLSEDGFIMTNNHVVDGARRIEVTLDDSQTLEAVVIGVDLVTDLAVIKVDASGLKPATLGDSSVLEVGEDVIAIGHALGLPGGPTVSKGVVSALGRSIEEDQNTIVDLIQTDAEINPGNSGGALVNDRAQVIGINTAIIQTGRGIGFAINVNDAKQVIAQLQEQGFVDRGFLGVSTINLSAAIASYLGLPDTVTSGVVITRVIPDFPAASSGVPSGAVIVRLGDTPIRNTGELSKYLLAHLPGENIEVEYYVGTRVHVRNITLADRPR